MKIFYFVTFLVFFSSIALAQLAPVISDGTYANEEGKLYTLAYTIDKDTSLSFTYSFKGREATNGEMKVLKSGKEIQKLSVPLFAPPMNFKVLNEGPFNPGSKAIGLAQSYEACDYPSGETVFIWDGKKLVQGPDVHVSNGEGMIANMEYDLRWKKNCLQIDKTLVPDMTVEENKGRKNEVTSKYFVWNGKALIEGKACPK